MKSFVSNNAARACINGAVLCASISTASAVFTEVSAIDSGITHVQSAGILLGSAAMTGGAAAGDFDGDGLVDLFFTRIDGSDVLYKNLGNGSFQDVSLNAGFSSNLPTNGPVFGDIDNDGDEDLFSVTEIFNGAHFATIAINDGNGSFTPGPPLEILNGRSIMHTGADFDGDGDTDVLYLDFENEQLNILFNNGDGTLTPGTPFASETQSAIFDFGLVDADGNGDVDSIGQGVYMFEHRDYRHEVVLHLS